MLNNRLRHTTLAAALPLLLLAACQSDELPTPAPQPGGSTLTFTVDAGLAETRSLPENPQTEAGKEAVQHVDAVRLYIFRHGNGDQAYLAGYEAIDNWETMTAEDGTGEPVAGYAGWTTVRKEYTLQTALLPNTQYTLLAVGVERDADGDDTENKVTENATSIFGDYAEYTSMTGGTFLPNTTQDAFTNAADESQFTQGTSVTLSKLATVLAEGRGKEDIARNEYFSGTTTVTTNSSGRLPDGTVVAMRRRVAGMSACFRLTGFSTKPKAVAVMLWHDQNKAVPTLKRDWQDDNFTDYLNSHNDWDNSLTGLQNPQCIVYTNELKEATDTEGGYVTDLLSAYVLPAKAPAWDDAPNYTLCVAVYNDEFQIICTKRAALAEDGNLIFNTSLGTGIVDDESYYRYPIVANRFYRFGTENNRLEVKYDPNAPFEVAVDPNWEGMPDLGLTD